MNNHRQGLEALLARIEFSALNNCRRWSRPGFYPLGWISPMLP